MFAILSADRTSGRLVPARGGAFQKGDYAFDELDLGEYSNPARMSAESREELRIYEVTPQSYVETRQYVIERDFERTATGLVKITDGRVREALTLGDRDPVVLVRNVHARTLARVKAVAAAKKTAGIEWSPDGGATVHVVQTRDQDLINVEGAYTAARDGHWVEPFDKFRMRDNVFHALTPEQAQDMALAVFRHRSACVAALTDHEAALAAIRDDAETSDADKLAALEGYDAAAGWPATAAPVGESV